MNDIYLELKDSNLVVTEKETDRHSKNVYFKCPECNTLHDITKKINHYHYNEFICNCCRHFHSFIGHDFDYVFKDVSLIYTDRKYITNFLVNDVSINDVSINDDYNDDLRLSRNTIIEENINSLINEPIDTMMTYNIADRDNVNIGDYTELYSDELFLVNHKDSEAVASIKNCNISSKNILLINDDCSIERSYTKEIITDIIFDYNDDRDIFTRKELAGYKNKRFYVKCPACGKLHDITGKLGYCRDNIFICDCNTHGNNSMNITDFMETLCIEFIYSYKDYVHEFLIPFKDHEQEITPENINVIINSNNKICNDLINILDSNVYIESYNIKDPSVYELNEFVEKHLNVIFLVYIDDVYALLNILYHKISLDSVLLIDDKYKVIKATYDILLDKLSSHFKGRKVGEML